MKKENLMLSVALMASIMVISCGGDGSNESTTPNKVTIGHQVWSDNNLNIDKFRNGDPIPLALSGEEARTEGENHKPVRMVISDTTLHTTYYLYNWYTVNDPRGLAPDGWHVPSKEEFYTLISEMKGNSEIELEKLNIIDTDRWWTTTTSYDHEIDATSVEFRKNKKKFLYKNNTDKYKLYSVRCIKDY